MPLRKHQLTIALTLALSSAFTSSTFAQSEKDILKDAVDPLNLTKQRVAFLRVAGVDSEINQSEFEKDLEDKNRFARKFDKWSQVLKFDKNKNKSLDWFEALEYRKNLRKQVILEFDADGDNKLKGEEREKAAKGIFKINVLSSDKSKRSNKSQKTTERDMKRPPTPPDDTPAKQPKLPKHMQEFDANNNGRLDPDEAKAMREKQMENWRKQREKRMDTDNDGVVTLEERRANQQREYEQGMKQMTKQFDKDEDGELSQQEAQQASQFITQQMNEGMNRMLQNHFDKDKDGQLNEEEKTAQQQFNNELNQLVEKRKAQIAQKYDANNNGQLDTFEALKFFTDKQDAKLVREHNGESEPPPFFQSGEKFDPLKQAKSEDSIDMRAIFSSVDFGKVITTKPENWNKYYEQEKRKGDALRKAQERRNQAIKDRLNKKR